MKKKTLENQAALQKGAEFSHSVVAPFCFDHNFFIRTPFWVILVMLEILESVESKYRQKEHF